MLCSVIERRRVLLVVVAVACVASLRSVESNQSWRTLGAFSARGGTPPPRTAPSSARGSSFGKFSPGSSDADLGHTDSSIRARVSDPEAAGRRRMEEMGTDSFIGETTSLSRSGTHEYCVLGAGPAGLQMTFFLLKSGRDVVVVERASEVASFYVKYPRHRTLISLNKLNTGRGNAEFNLRHDWHSLISDNETLLFRHFSDEWWPPAEHYLRYAAEYATHTGVRDRILFNWNVRSVERDESTAGMDFNEGKGGFIVSSTDGERMACRRVIAATGYSKEVMPEGVPGMEEHTVSYGDHDLDLSKYVNKSVLILGMGNTAFETANHLARVASWVHIFSRTGKPNMAWQTHYVGDLRAINADHIDQYLLKSLDAVTGGIPIDRETSEFAVRESPITGEPAVCFQPPNYEETHAGLVEGVYGNEQFTPQHSLGQRDFIEATEYQISCFDYVIRCLGFSMDKDPFTAGGLHIEMFKPQSKPGQSHILGEEKGKFPKLTEDYESVSEPGLYFAGVLGHGHDYKHSAGGFLHGFRYVIRATWRLLEQRWHSGHTQETGTAWKGWPGLRRVSAAVPDLVDAILYRTNTASGPYQMFGELGDMIVLPHGWFAGKGGEDEGETEADLLEEVPLRAGESLVPWDRGYIHHYLDFMEGIAEVGGFVPILHNYDPAKGHWSTLLHPIVNVYEPATRPGGPRKKHQWHLLEDLHTRFESDVLYVRPLTKFLDDVGSGRQYEVQQPLDLQAYAAMLQMGQVGQVEEYLGGGGHGSGAFDGGMMGDHAPGGATGFGGHSPPPGFSPGA